MKKLAGVMRQVFARNLARWMNQRYGDDVKDKPLAMQRDLKQLGYTITKSSIQRYLNSESGATIDNIEAIAALMDIPTYQLLIPDERIAPAGTGTKKSRAMRAPAPLSIQDAAPLVPYASHAIKRAAKILKD